MTFWLSFVDEHRRPGERFLGVAIVEVCDDEYQLSKVEGQLRGWPNDPYSVWTRAAVDKAWQLGCNPGGQVGSVMIEAEALPSDTPRGKLMQKDELARRNLL